MPRIQYKAHNFTEKTLAIIEHANDLIADYALQNLSLTLRQLYYRFVAADLLPNSQKSYNRLGEIVNNARLAGLMDWEAIEDRGRNLIRQSHWDNASDILESAAAGFNFDKWEDQPCRVEVWVEKQALEAVVGQAAEPYDCAYFACKGYTSQSEMWRAAMRFHSYRERGQTPVVIHLGDHDPSGVDMTRDIFDRLNELYGVQVEVDRIALNMPQIRKHKPPPNPAKVSDSRAGKYIKRFGHSSWELDALEPATLRDLIQGAIKARLKTRKWNARVKAEKQVRADLGLVADRWDEVLEFLEDEE